MQLSEINTWVLLRGLSREAQHWGGFLSLCRNRFPHKNFITLDLPGCGKFYQQASPLSIAGIRQHLEIQLLECAEVNHGEPVGLIALSLGGMVALDWWSHDQQKIAAVVVMNSSANHNPLFWRFRPGALAHAFKAICSLSAYRREKHILRMVSQYYHSDAQLIDEWQFIQKMRPVSLATFIRQLIAAARFSLPNNLPKTHGLVLASSNDQMVSSRCSKSIAAHYSWPLALNNLAGHEMTLDQPLWVVDQLEQWWNECS